MTKPKLVEPVIKWSGSKRSVAASIARLIPNSTRIFEPFVGGGALLPFYEADQVFVGDIIKELISLWLVIQNSPELVTLGYEHRWKRLQLEGHTAYYHIRETFNQSRDPIDLLFLSRTCVNGLIRFNKDGNFNNSLHHSRPGIHPSRLRNIIYSWSRWAKKVSFYAMDYRETLTNVRKGDFVFLDPPYVGTKGRYLPQEFSFFDFYQELDRLNRIGARWLLTLDGHAGNRKYNSQVPTELYVAKLDLQTGNSPFTKLMGASLDSVHESMYLNYELLSESLPRTTQSIQQPLWDFMPENM